MKSEIWPFLTDERVPNIVIGLDLLMQSTLSIIPAELACPLKLLKLHGARPNIVCVIFGNPADVSSITLAIWTETYSCIDTASTDASRHPGQASLIPMSKLLLSRVTIEL